MTSTLLLGDLHLGKNAAQGKAGIGSHLNSRIADQISLLEHVLDRAIELGIGHIIITGDCFEDARPHPSLIAMFVAWLKKCQAHGVHIHIILGNHDMIRTGAVFVSSLDIISEMDLDGINVYKNVNTIVLGSSAFTLLPYRDRKCFSVSSNAEAVNLIRESLIHELASIPNTYKKFLIGHLAIEGSIPVGDEIDDIANELYCPLDMFNGYDYVWMGHVHKPQTMQKENPFIAHIGSMDVSNFVEIEQKKHIVIIDCDAIDHDYSIEYLPTRPLKKIVITVPKDTEDTTSYVIEEIKKTEDNFDQAIVRVEVSLASPELKSLNKGQIEKFLITQGAFNITGISESKKIAFIKKDNSAIIDNKMDVPSAIKAYADKCIDVSMRADYIELAMEIYNLYKAENKE